MTTTAANREYLNQLANTRDVIAQAEMEGAALRGELGIERQLIAMSAKYLALRAAGKLDEAKAVKTQAYAIYTAQQEA